MQRSTAGSESDEARSVTPDSRAGSRSGSPHSPLAQLSVSSNGDGPGSRDEQDGRTTAEPMDCIGGGCSLLASRRSLAASNPNISCTVSFAPKSAVLCAPTLITQAAGSTAAAGVAGGAAAGAAGSGSGRRGSTVMSTLRPATGGPAAGSASSGRKPSISICFICELPILTHQCWSSWPSERSPGLLTASGAVAAASGPQYANVIHHDDCLTCSVCSARLKPNGGAKRHLNSVYCPLHYADVSGLGSGGDEFMAKLRDFKRQSLGCAGAFCGSWLE